MVRVENESVNRHQHHRQNQIKWEHVDFKIRDRKVGLTSPVWLEAVEGRRHEILCAGWGE